jgi:hypothetical protein
MRMCRSNPGRPLADELLQLLSSITDSSSAAAAAAARRRIGVLLEDMQAVEGLQFDERLLQGGPWRVSTCPRCVQQLQPAHPHARDTSMVQQQPVHVVNFWHG